MDRNYNSEANMVTPQSDQQYKTGNIPDSKIHGANTGTPWGRQDPGGPMLVPWTLLPGIVSENTLFQI